MTTWQLLIKFETLNIIFIIIAQLFHVAAASGPLQVVYAVNCGGDEHIDRNGIRYEADPLRGLIGTESDYGKQLLMIGRVPQADEILYQTERYHTATFGYDLPLSGDGDYVLILKFCEVYFNEPRKKVFDILINGDITAVAELDIFAHVGKGVAHDEYIYFTISKGRLYYREDPTELKHGSNKLRIEFVHTGRDNPKINAFALLKGDVEHAPKLVPVGGDEALPTVDVESTTEEAIEKPAKPRKTSGPKQPDPYSADDSSVMLPVFIAIGAFIPLLFCLCKL